MIGRLHGTLVAKHPPELLIDVNGVGYEVSVPMTCFYDLPETGAEVTLWTHFVVREDAQLLFGFNTADERALFRLLIKAQGVGPKLALTILSGMSAGQFIQTVQHNDVTTLVKIPGVGKKTAERLVVEMRDRLKDFTGADYDTGLPGAAISTPSAAPAPSAKEEALSALIALGYKPNQAETMIRKVATEDMDAETLIRTALKAML
ncbi:MULTISPECIES: Holliday junction branch migration protein RuvA [Gammaproteobacteria]|uniref:Holliday junction branch migration protein RuvA n=1 Tax=Gammaproteobacteria TaxID=1236 RepID=UPI000DD00E45|nr:MULTISPECIES: Holliday junction branch migration protein RuvA [Gammaproteobacteria]RTE86097.1 Holliday junction branch migration protein RuvA [Aliidiomarina sp. B3213]TCZ91450.1 Holliday junction branch migration protein RuvA [Lysobacter sp. N42]